MVKCYTFFSDLSLSDMSRITVWWLICWFTAQSKLSWRDTLMRGHLWLTGKVSSESVRFSSETTRPIPPMMIPINWGNNVDVQHALHFDLDPSMTAGQGHEILRFCELFFLTGSSLCSLLLRNYLTDSSNGDTNQLREQCRCATCTSFWPWPLHDGRSRSPNTSILWI